MRDYIMNNMGILFQVFTALTILASVVAAVFGWYTHHRDWAILCSWLAALFVVSTFFSWFLDMEWKRDEESSQSNPFSVKSSWFINQVGGGQIWFVKDGTITHIPTAMVIYFTNLKADATMIYTCWPEEKQPDGTWKNIGLPFGVKGQVFMGSDLKDVVEFKFPLFEEVVEDQNILPNQTVRGWLFFTSRLTSQVRLAVTDMSGAVATEPIEPLASGGGWPPGPDQESLHTHHDISNLLMNQ